MFTPLKKQTAEYEARIKELHPNFKPSKWWRPRFRHVMARENFGRKKSRRGRALLFYLIFLAALFLVFKFLTR